MYYEKNNICIVHIIYEDIVHVFLAGCKVFFLFWEAEKD